MASVEQLLDVLKANITANTILNKADWDSIDNKYVVGNVRKTQAYKCFNDITNNTDDMAKLLRSHQLELVKMLDAHLALPGETRPALRIIYSTPTGSGKTFSSMLLSKLILKKHPGQPLLIYSVPTKEILKRVGTDCEAHGINYWTAGKIGDEYFIRRPYCIRTSKENAGQQRGDMFLQLLITIAQSIKYEDKVKGRCHVILADIEATARILEVINENPAVLKDIRVSSIDGKSSNQPAYKPASAASSGHDDDSSNPASSHHSKSGSSTLKKDHELLDAINNPETRPRYTSWLDPANVVLFFDEPNMGIHISEAVNSTVKRIINNLPNMAILASATLKTWDALPDWWRGSASIQSQASVIYKTITCMPYNLPHAGLDIFTSTTSKTNLVSVLDLFKNHSQFSDFINSASDISLGQLVRHFTDKQYIALTDIQPPKTDELYNYRKDTVIPVLKSIGMEKYNKLRSSWSDYVSTSYPSLRQYMSQTGITLIATLNPLKAARELTGFSSQEDWDKAYHNVRRAVKHCQTRVKERERETAKAEKLKSKRDKPEDDVAEQSSTPIKLKLGELELYADELDDLTEESMILLSRGIAISSPDADPGIKLQFQKAIYARPEHIMIKPIINILVVDYASVYGFDCPGVDKIVLYDDLGDLLSHEDTIQFIGRLRRAGNASFMSYKNIIKLVSPGHNIDHPDASTLLKEDISQLFAELYNGDNGPTPPNHAITCFKHMCRRLYNGISFSQEEILLTMLEFIINTGPAGIKYNMSTALIIAEHVEVSDSSIVNLLNEITPLLASYNNSKAVGYVIIKLYEGVNDNTQLYKSWNESNVQLSYPALYEIIQPIIKHMESLDETAEESE